MEEASVVGKIIITGKLHLESPLIIGSGKDDYADIEVLKDDDKPYIPATSFIGVLRHYFYDNFPNDWTQETKQFWGFSEKVKSDGEFKQKSIQSALMGHDLYSPQAATRIRDGVKIDPKNQIAEEKDKYDYEVIERGAIFDFFWEVTLRKHYNAETFRRILSTLIEPLKSGSISLGAKTGNGFGKCKLKTIQVSEFDFTKKDDILRWMKQDFSKGKPNIDSIPFSKENNSFSIKAKFAIKNSIIVRSYSEAANMPDATSITSNGEFVLPGTSIKGAVRNRATKILKTFCDDGDAKKRIDCLFGIAGKDSNDKKIKSRVLIEERKIKNVIPEMQNRIMVDRFTGGTIKTALFNSMPLWPDDKNSESITIVIKIINYNQWEAGLMLQVLKDLWCEDLPLGGEKNVGRGVLQGIHASVKWKDQEIVIKSKDGVLELDESSATELNNFVRSFGEYIQEVA